MRMYREDFEAATAVGCQDVGCEGCGGFEKLALSGSCHPGTPVHARFDKGSGGLQLSCSVCSSAIVSVAVAWLHPKEAAN